MDSTLNSALIAIISGLITTFIIIVLRGIWKKIILPWYENTLYKDALIEGKWIGGFVDIDEIDELVDFPTEVDKVNNTASDGTDKKDIGNKPSSKRNGPKLIKKAPNDINKSKNNTVTKNDENVDDDFEIELEEKFVMSINRIGHNIKGDLICIRGEDEGKSWSIEGKFKNLLLTLNFESTDRHSYDRGCIVMMLINNGKKFLGHLVSYFDNEHSTFSTKFEMYRE